MKKGEAEWVMMSGVKSGLSMCVFFFMRRDVECMAHV